MAKKLNVCIVGCGWVADWHVRDGLVHIPELYNVVACCDPDDTRRNAFGDRYGIDRRLTDIDQVLAMDDVDVVTLCTPPSTHYPLALKVLEAGKNCVCEKPLTDSLKLTDAMIEADKKSRGTLMPVFQFRYGDGSAKVRHLIQSGLAGKLYASSVETWKSRGADYYAVEWRGKFAFELGGVLVTQAIHNHDILMWLVGPASAVSCMKTTRVNPIEVEDCAVANLTMADGSVASLTATLGSARQLARLRLCFENVTIERAGYDEELSATSDEPWIVIPRTPELADAINAKMAEVKPAHRWFARLYELLYDSLVNDAPLPVTLQDARRSLELITAMYHSAETGCVQTLPIGPDHPKYAGWGPKPAK